jgi:serine/threonine-protein kinase HipA
MTSDRQLFVWMYLPDAVEPIVCGRFVHRHTPGGQDVGTFVYGKSYLARDDAVPIDPIALPLHERPFSTVHLSGWFSALLDGGPDEWGKRLIDRLHGAQDTSGYFLKARGEAVGALAFSADAASSPAAPANASPVNTLERLVEVHRQVEAGEEVSAEDGQLLVQGTSAGGARPKTTIEDDQRLWLAKFPSSRDSPDQPANPAMEAALLDVASACHIRVPPHRLVQIGGQPVLLVERFDRHPTRHGRYLRRRYASARTVLWSQPDVLKYSFMGSYTNLTRRMSIWERSPREDIRELFRRISFNCLVGNTDDHDCNTGFVAGDDGFMRLSPVFDLSARPATGRMYLAMSFGSSGAEVSLANLLSECEQFDHTNEEARDVAQSQWETISNTLVDKLVANGVPERLAMQAFQSMPGHRFF